MDTIFLVVIGFLVFVYSIILHEIAHGLVAERLGDPTARLQGRLTLNPFPHIDLVMSMLLPLFLLLTRSPLILGAAKPVPIDPFNLRRPRQDLGLIGLAGPAANLLLAVLFALIARLFSPPLAIMGLLVSASLVNIILAVFNLIPIPPLDGGRVLAAILPPRFAGALMSLENLGLFIVLLLLFFPTPFFSLQTILYQVTTAIFRLIFPGFPSA